MTYEEIKDMNTQELHANLKAERTMLQKIEFNHAVSPIENPGKIAASKKVIARLLTEINKRRVSAGTTVEVQETTVEAKEASNKEDK